MFFSHARGRLGVYRLLSVIVIEFIELPSYQRSSVALLSIWVGDLSIHGMS